MVAMGHCATEKFFPCHFIKLRITLVEQRTGLFNCLNFLLVCFELCVFSAAVSCIGGMYEKLGRMVGRSYEETITVLIKALKNAEVKDTFSQCWKTDIDLSQFDLFICL